jgi:hypothetical protein
MFKHNIYKGRVFVVDIGGQAARAKQPKKISNVFFVLPSPIFGTDTD